MQLKITLHQLDRAFDRYVFYGSASCCTHNEARPAARASTALREWAPIVIVTSPPGV